MIAQTAAWVVMTRDAWVRATAHVITESVRRSQPYQTAENPFQGRCVEIVTTLGM